ncbi:MAG: zf-HC2 domain-containing protein [Lentisphaeria bacterium]|jgi:hypothetical protein|nr:zf-HC2 domain-containing protein [Lentisphaeria bacterium]MDP7740089.1 zf-HC2 domain-containing protein [Lentisphaeria bacterium]
MNTCHDIETLLTDYALDELDAGRAAAVGEHLADCPACQAVLDDIRQVVSTVSTAFPVDSSVPNRLAAERIAAITAPATAAPASDTGAKPLLSMIWRSPALRLAAAVILVFGLAAIIMQRGDPTADFARQGPQKSTEMADAATAADEPVAIAAVVELQGDPIAQADSARPAGAEFPTKLSSVRELAFDSPAASASVAVDTVAVPARSGKSGDESDILMTAAADDADDEFTDIADADAGQPPAVLEAADLVPVAPAAIEPGPGGIEFELDEAVEEVQAAAGGMFGTEEPAGKVLFFGNNVSERTVAEPALTATLALPPPDPVGAGSVALVADDAEGGLDLFEQDFALVADPEQPQEINIAPAEVGRQQGAALNVAGRPAEETPAAAADNQSGAITPSNVAESLNVLRKRTPKLDRLPGGKLAGKAKRKADDGGRDVLQLMPADAKDEMRQAQLPPASRGGKRFNAVAAAPTTSIPLSRLRHRPAPPESVGRTRVKAVAGATAYSVAGPPAGEEPVVITHDFAPVPNRNVYVLRLAVQAARHLADGLANVSVQVTFDGDAVDGYYRLNAAAPVPEQDARNDLNPGETVIMIFGLNMRAEDVQRLATIEVTFRDPLTGVRQTVISTCDSTHGYPDTSQAPAALKKAVLEVILDGATGAAGQE